MKETRRMHISGYIIRGLSRYYLEVLIVVLCLVLSRFIQVTYEIIDFSYPTIFLRALTVIIIFHVFYYFFPVRKHAMIVIGVIVAALTVAAVYAGETVMEYIRINYFSTTLKLIDQVAANKATLFSDYLPYVHIIAVLIFLILCVIYYFSPTKAFLVLFFALMVMSASGLDYHLKDFTAWFVLIMLSYGIVSVYMKQYKYRLAETAYPGKGIIIYSLLISTVIVFFAQLSINIFGSTSYLDRFGFIRDSVYQAFVQSFNISASGYREGDTVLGGSVYPNRLTALRVKADQHYYLRGNVKTEYTGRGWKEAQNEKVSNEIKYSLTGKDTGQYTKIRVVHGSVVSSTFFAPINTYAIKDPRPLVINSDGIYSLLTKQHITGDYSIYLEKPGSVSDISYSTLQTAKDSYLNQYLYVPGIVPSRVHKLVTEITKGAVTPQQKIDRIAEYLDKNFTYSQVVADIPEQAEFTDHFLFTTQKGYCTYFATASVIMFRIAGIPSRYVEGFMMINNRDSRGNYIVTNDMAHAWPEVLVDPGTNTWKIVDTSPQSFFATSAVSFWQEYYQSQIARYREERAQPVTGTVPVKPEKSPLSPFLTLFISDFIFNGLYVLIFFVIVMIGFIVLFIVKGIVRNKYIFTPESNVEFYRYVRKKLVLYGYFRTQSETLEESLISSCDSDLRKVIAMLMDAYTQEVFGGRYVAVDRRAMFRQLKMYLRNFGYIKYLKVFVFRF